MKKFHIKVKVTKIEEYIVEAENKEDAETFYYEGTPTADCYDEDLEVISVEEIP